ncbi:MAG: AAA family ATPase [Nitrosomonas sp.]|uniref:AAA family ATPase n=1 Tax=Nitrosomonas sp. TaxID=42353 RepID=UPI0027303E42|nr:AAA family ATPase [Nitrosomonas sp.]MDP1549138.1 AAA family ATPase [Nitrosomonas sp.]
MRLKSVFISQYKNLKNFTLSFDGASFIDVFVGKNGSGKSNLFEALIEIFRHLDQLGRADNDIAFDYNLRYEIEGQDTEIEWKADKLRINQDEDRKTLGQTPFPDNVLIYYSGHNTTVSELVSEYEMKFRGRIKGANLEDSRRFIGIGPEYKALLLAVLLVQPEDSKAHTFIRQKLGVDKLGITKPGTDEISEPVLRVALQRPDYARGSEKEKYDIDPVETATRYWRPVGITKDFLDTLSICTWANTEKLTVNEGYFPNEDRYVLYLSIGKLQEKFVGKWQELFRQFDNLKTLRMLDDISVPLRLVSGMEGNINHFSDGQFQSVYIYSIVELFKDRNCLILLDEPDAFLHPEWQFDFLRQVFEITDAAAKTSHVLMSSHSASTITCANESVISLFEFDGEKVALTKVNKADVIKSLSAGLITFSESEARLSINHFLQSTSGDVLFTEGVTDEKIIETAWSKMYPNTPCSFGVQNAFDRIFLRNLFSRDELKNNFPNRRMFALFDFDEAFDDWNGLKKARDEVTDPSKGLAKQLQHLNHYALLLPVPNVGIIKRQVLDDTHKPWGRGQDSHLSIELLFFKEEWIGEWFRRKTASAGAEIIEFSGDKVKFANEIVPALDAVYFEPFRPVFEFIMAKCVGGVTP